MERRDFLTNGLFIGCCAAASPAFSPMAFASVPGEQRLVIIVLRGGMDGLDVIQPHGDPLLRKLRPGFKIGPNQGALPLTGFFSMHPGLSGLRPLWNAGELSFAHAVSTPYRDKRSHFDGQDLLEAGTGPRLPLPLNQTGWLNRMVQSMPKVTTETAYNVGVDAGIILRGAGKSSEWNPDVTMKMNASGIQLLRSACGRDSVFLHALDRAASISMSSRVTSNDAQSAVRYANFIANKLRGQSRIASFSISGWDTHAAQSANLPDSLNALASAILTLKKDLGTQVWKNTTIMAMTEFGRTVQVNGSNGTDHGTGGALIMAGGTLKGKSVHGKWPGLANLYQDRDLLPTGDIRAYPAWAMHKLFGISKGQIENIIFPGLSMGADPNFLA